MDSDEACYEFEFNLGKELINSLITLDSFSNKWDFNKVHDRILGIDDGAKLESCHRHSIAIEKISADESKIFVKIYKIVKELENKDSSTQTRSIETKNERLQTHQSTFVTCSIQTECDMKNSKTQTPGIELASMEIQTRESRLQSEMVDKGCESEFNLSTQLHKDIMAIQEVTESNCQAVVDMMDSSCQSVISVASVEIQNTPDISSSHTQTDIKELFSTISQTSSSIACEAEADVQAVAETTEQSIQTQVCLTECISQTDMSMFLQKDCHVQATVELETNAFQTELDTADTSIETDFNLSTQCHKEVEISAEVTEVCLQTESAEEVNSFCLTDCNLSSQESKDVQTTPLDVTLNETSGLDDSSVFNATLDQSCSIANETHDGNLTNNSHFTSISSILVDGVSQTDPVTIIIGDASFLVQKLKNSAMSSSKVTTSGNEIEIELSADAVDEVSEERKQSPTSREIPVEVKPTVPENIQTPKLSPHRTGGVRMRMPVSVSHPSLVNAPVRVPQSPLIQPRTPNLSSVASYQKNPQPGQSQAKTSSGLFSCPFCNLCFIESPALYEHLSDIHQSDLKSKWKKSQGREGKTIIPRNNQQIPPTNKKLSLDASKAANKPNLTINEAESDNARGSNFGSGVKRKRECQDVPQKYRKADEGDEDDEDYEEEEEIYTRPKSSRGRRAV